MSIESYFITLFSEYIGKDAVGNKYYQSKKRRYVIYQGLKEPSKVPPMWNAWLRHLVDKPPSHDQQEGHNWQKKHLPNLTGTKEAYHMTRKIVSSDYQPWKPS